MNTKEITLDEFIKETHEKEKHISEPANVTAAIRQMAAELRAVAEGQGIGDAHNPDVKARIITDYDADGICSAYIVKRTLEAINPDINLEVICNDRRGSYGVPDTIKGEFGTTDIILDMGSNQLGYIQTDIDIGRENSTLIIDHHIIDSDIAKKQFQDNSKYLNPHCYKESDGKSAEYCATGLAYRCYQELKEQEALRINTETLDRSVAIYAAIGTATDVVDLMDMHGNNRDIVKQGIEYINTANPDNTDYVLGAVIDTVGVSESTTAYEIAYNVGAYFNAASRMSEVIDTNGAQILFDTLTSNPTNDLNREPNSHTCYAIEDFNEVNRRKKDINKLVTESPEYKGFVDEHKDNLEDNIAVFIVPKDIEVLNINDEPISFPAAMNGLIAGRLENEIDKAIIVLSERPDGTYTGSGRSPEGFDNLKDYVDRVVSEAGIEVKYGGHEQAIGISSIQPEDLNKFVKAIESHAEEYQRPIGEQKVIRLTAEELTNSDLLLEKVKSLEPVGQGLRIPPVILEGVEQRKTQGFKAGNPQWKDITIKTDLKDDNNKAVVARATDWSYPTYPSGDKDKISALTEVGISHFRGEHVEFTVKYNADFAKEHSLEREQEKPKKMSVGKG